MKFHDKKICAIMWSDLRREQQQGADLHWLLEEDIVHSHQIGTTSSAAGNKRVNHESLVNSGVFLEL